MTRRFVEARRGLGVEVGCFMCCFSRPVKHVSQTSIFARSAPSGGQLLVYSMSVRLAEDLAMILPLPVPPGAPDDAVRFLDLSAYPGFFRDMGRAFPEIMAQPRGGLMPSRAGGARPPLQVHAVGLFEASFVPTLGDFDRLDPRFRLSPRVGSGLPQYSDYGFAVFKLRRPGGLWGWLRRTRTIHPMAMEFPRRDIGSLFFPTVHVHDGEVHGEASFDHTLYCQPDPHWEILLDWERSEHPLGRHVRGDTAGIVAADRHGYRRVLHGPGPNRDVVVDERGLLDGAALGEHFLVRVTPSGGAGGHPGGGWPAVTQAERGAMKDALVDKLSALTRDRRDAWRLARYGGELPERWPTFYESFPEEAGVPPQDEPCRVKFFVWNQRAAPVDVSLAFSDAPSRELREAITGELQRLLDEVSPPS